MKLASTASTSSASRRLARAVAIVRTQMGHGVHGDSHLLAARAALRARRGAGRLLDAHMLPGLEGGS